MIVSSKGFEPIEPTCPVHPEQELRIEFGKRGRTGFCPLCPMHYSVCEEWKGMWPCMKLHGHEGEHSGKSMTLEFDQLPGVRFSGVVGEMQAFTPRPERGSREIYELPAPAEHSTNLATGKLSGSCSATNVFVDLGEQFSPEEFADRMKGLGLLPEEATEAWISRYAVVRPPGDDVLVNEASITYTSRQPLPQEGPEKGFVVKEKVHYVDPNSTSDLPAALAGRVERPSTGCTVEGPSAFDPKDLRKLMKTTSFSFSEGLMRCGHDAERVPPLPGCRMCGGTGRRVAKLTLLTEAGVYEAESLRSLIWEVLKHRMSHLLKGEGWVD